MFELDKSCRDIMMSYWLNHVTLGKDLQHQYKSNSIGKDEYLSTREEYFSAWLDTIDYRDVINFLKSQEYYKFDVDKQLDKLKYKTAAYIIEPLLVEYHNDHGIVHYELTAKLSDGMTIIKVLPLDPDQYRELLTALENKNYYCCGFTWNESKSGLLSASTLIFGEEEACKELKERLKGVFRISR